MLDEYMSSIGFTEDDIDSIQMIFPPRLHSPSTLLYNLKNLHHFFVEMVLIMKYL